MGKNKSKMEKENNTPMESAEEIEAEQEHLSEVKEDDLRQEIITTYGFNEEDDKERIDKALEREVAHRKSLSSAIGQKRKYREALQSSKKDTPKTDTDSKKEKVDLDKKVNEGIQAALEQRDLDEMEYPDEIKTVIKQVAQINNTSVRKAVKDPYVVAKIQAWEDEQDTDGAALSRNNKTGGKPSRSTDSDLTPPDVDLSTEEGRKDYDEWKANMVAKGY